MNKKKMAVWILAVCVSRAMGMVEAPGARSPIGSPTQVPSAGRTGAIAAQPNLYGYVGNLTITGNVGGGRHFRGFVPYGSMDYLDSRIMDPGTLAVSSFVRRSSTPGPYYDPARTVPSLGRAGSAGFSSPILSPQGRTSTASDQWLGSFDLTELLQAPQQRPLASSAQSMEAVLDQQIARDLLKARVLPPEPAKTAMPGIDLSLPPVTPQIPTPPVPLEQTTGREERPVRETGELSIYQRIHQDLLKSSSVEVPAGEPDDPGTLPAEDQPQETGADPYKSSLIVRPEQVIDRADGRRALRNSPDYQHLAETRAAEYLAVGERMLKQGHYYKAADAFELAHVWDRGNTLLVLARSHALFAAGEYMSSAFYLGQALREKPGLIQSRIEWAALLDTRDAFENRLVELSTWQQRSNSPELAFLMGYVLYLDDKLSRAEISAEYALDFMPDNAAVQILVEAIKKAQNPEPAGSAAPGNP